MVKKISAAIGALDLLGYVVLVFMGKISGGQLGVQLLLVAVLLANFWEWENQHSVKLFSTTLNAFVSFCVNVFLFFIPLAFLISQFRQEFGGLAMPYFWLRQIFPFVLFIYGIANSTLYIIKVSNLLKD